MLEGWRQRLSSGGSWLSAGLVLLVAAAPGLRAAPGPELPAAELLALTRGQRVERVLARLDQSGAGAVAFLFDEPSLWPALPDVFREASPRQRAALLDAARLAGRGGEALEQVLPGLVGSDRVGLLRAGLLDGREPHSSFVRGLLGREPVWIAELLDLAEAPGEVFQSLAAEQRALGLQALIRPPAAEADPVRAPVPEEPLWSLQQLALSVPLIELRRALSAQAPEALAAWLERVAQERWQAQRNETQVFWPPLLLASAADCLDAAAWSSVAHELRNPGPVARLLARFGRNAGRAAELARAAGDGELWIAEDLAALAHEILAAPGDRLRDEWPARLERLPLYQQGLVQAALVQSLARQQAWPQGESPLAAPAGRPLLRLPGPGHPVKDLLLDWIVDRLAPRLGPASTLVLCAGWVAGGVPADCPEPGPIAPCTLP
jgi:hypothetical protein